MSLARVDRSDFDDRLSVAADPVDDRVPPQDVGAEQSVLGSMLLSKDAIADSIEVLKGTDFYRPAHELVYEAILDLYGRGEPADAITVADELTKRGELSRVGGQSYLHQLISAVPTAANAGYYAQIVAERAVLRRLVDAGTRIVQLGYGTDGGDVEEIVNTAQAEVYAVADKRGGEDYHLLGELLEATADEIEQASGSTGEMVGVPTGFTDLDDLTNGLHPGQMIVIAARPAMGKALALDTPLPTPSGWTTMGEVSVGDEVLGADGKPTKVVAATEVMKGRPCYEVGFSDGGSIVADEEHLWPVVGGPISTTADIGDRLAGGDAVHVDGERRFAAITPVPSVPVRCIQVEASDHLYLAGQSMVPTHNSTLALDFARAAAIHNDMATVVFSLEMSRNEITMRLLSAEAQIQLQHMRKGTMRDEDWSRLARTMGEVSEAPLFIDDSPNMSLMEIRAKCRRLKQRHNLKMVIIDYLQLMSSGKRVESRQQEVSEFSRALKLLAKEIEVPVIALSQLNRGPEQRTDKKPQVSDLRESGCLTADTRILRADTGAEVTIGELAASGEKDVPVWALDESLRYVRRPMTHAFSTGVKPVYRLTLASGKTVRATENHPFLTYDGWVPLGEITCGMRVAAPRHVSAPVAVEEGWADEDVRTGALLCAEHPSATVPSVVNSLPKAQIALFLRTFFSVAGGVTLSSSRPGGEVFCFADDRVRLDRLSRLLLRFGISCVITGDESGWVLDVVDVDSQRRFLQEIGIEGPTEQDAARLLEIVKQASSVPLPGEGQMALWQDVASALSPVTSDPTELADSDGSVGTLRQVAAVLDRDEADLEAINDVEWEIVVGVDFDGFEEVFDATVLDTHNFIADGIAVHNSIEQDADMVMLLHRESVYEPDSPREGEADIIVAKHRNGPTRTITVAFQGHYSRFTNMAATY
ncbi:MAG: replicative DNA helicase [Mobilicoccus sp.]|nr:replicative DNA helicase [Mobilicoccus sp.]